MPVTVDADLRLEVEATLRRVRSHVHLHGRANRFVVEVDDPGAFAGSQDAPFVRELAEGLAARGMVVEVMNEGERLVCLGAVSAPWWQRRLTGSRRIRLGSARGAWTAARARARRTESVLPSPEVTPPPTVWPLAPTFQRRVRRRPGTTHDPARGGGARLVLVRVDVWGGERQPIYWLGEGLSIGSDPSCDVVLPGLEPVHARVVHDHADEWVVSAVDGVTRVHGAAVGAAVLRTGTRVDVGPHHLVYYRDEYADHGRPHGGRIGGELGTPAPAAVTRGPRRPPRSRPPGRPAALIQPTIFAESARHDAPTRRPRVTAATTPPGAPA